MKALIIHISDVHLREKNNECVPKFDLIGTALQNEELDLDAIAVVVSGDMAYSGLGSEYQLANQCLTRLADDLQTRLKTANIRFVFVPGNHDCDFSSKDTVREMVIDGIRAGKVADSKMVQCCCDVQSEFFCFRDGFPSGKPDKLHNLLHWDYRITHGDHSIRFRCFNTAWMSVLHEKQGGLHMPESMLEVSSDGERDDYVLSVFHHPYNWMPAGTYRRFRSLAEESSDLILTGHEHEADHYQKYSFTGEVNEYLEGAVFQEHGRDDRAGFHAIYVDLSIQKQRAISFWWSKDRFIPSHHSDDWVGYKRGSRGGKRDFDLCDEFTKWLDDPGASYQHPAKPDLTLSDIYVFPNLKPFQIKNGNEFVYSSLIEGRDLLKTIGAKRRVILFGRQQSGKTTLAKVLFRDFYNKNLTPVLISGDELSSTHLKLARLEDLVEARFQKQYQNPLLPAFQQLDKDKTVVIIDDYDHSRLNAKGRQRLLEVLLARYDRVVILGDDILKMEEIASGSEGGDVLADFYQFEIIQFGHLLRSKLIGQWFSLGIEYEADQQEVEKRIHQTERLITSLLGKNYLPSYPVFILSLIQAQEATARLNSPAGTYGSLYEVLITQALAVHSSVGNRDLRLTYLSELAFWMHSERRRRVSDDEWEYFHQRHCAKFKIHPSREAIKKEFVASGILDFRDECFGFRHPASYYYFVARYLRDNLSKPEVRQLVTGLLEKLHKEEHASIWLFITHLSKDPFLVDAILEHAKRIYSDLPPAAFEADVNFIQTLTDKVERVALEEKRFEEVKEARLRKLDSIPDMSDLNDDMEAPEEEMDEALKMLAKMNLALRTLEVLGQLVKNFTGSLEGGDKLALVEECYCLGLRTVSMLFDVFQKDAESFVDLVVDRILERHPKVQSREDLKKKVKQFMFWMIEGASFGMVKRISQAVGHSQLGDTYKDVRQNNDTNATALIDISIHLDNLGFPEEQLKSLAKRFRSNFFCERLLKQLAVEHFYLFPTSEATKQKVCAALQIDYKNVRAIDATSVNQKQVARSDA